MVLLRQIEAAEIMVAMNKYTINYAKSLVPATSQAQPVDSSKPKRVNGLSEDQMALMERESANPEREFSDSGKILWRRPPRPSGDQRKSEQAAR